MNDWTHLLKQLSDENSLEYHKNLSNLKNSNVSILKIFEKVTLLNLINNS